MVRVFVGLVVLASCGWVQAAPLVYFTLEGRTHGSSDPFTSSVAVGLGDMIEYRLRANFAPQGTLNEHLPIGSQLFRPGKHGLNSLSISIVQDPADLIQVNLGSPVELTSDNLPSVRDGWRSGPGAQGGTPTFRPGRGGNDLFAIRPIHGPGVFTAAEEETIFTGVFSVTSTLGPSGQLHAEWGPVVGGGIFHGYTFFPSGPLNTNHRNTESSRDPLTHFTPLTLIANVQAVPEPSTIALVGTALIGLALVRRRSR